MATLTKKQKKVRNRIAAAAALLILFKLLPLSGWLQAVCFLIPYFIIGYDVLRKAFMGIANGQVFDENFLMAIATVGAFATGEFDEAVFVMLFYQTGELFQDYAVGKSRASIAALMDIRPDTANLETENGLEEVDPEDVTVGSVIVVKPGERVPLHAGYRRPDRRGPAPDHPCRGRDHQRLREPDGSAAGDGHKAL